MLNKPNIQRLYICVGRVIKINIKFKKKVLFVSVLPYYLKVTTF